jgi:HAD superfamily hydrolase (TIGR01509 family)
LESLARILAAHEIPFTWDGYCRLGRGVTDVQMLRSLPPLQSNPVLLASLQNEIAAQQQLVLHWSSQRSPIPAETASMLRGFSGFRIGLVTSSPRSHAEPLLRAAGILPCFRALVCGGDCARHKPHPEPNLLVRERLGVDWGLAFEDSDAGLASAKAAGFTAVRVGDPNYLPGIVAASLGNVT